MSAWHNIIRVSTCLMPKGTLETSLLPKALCLTKTKGKRSVRVHEQLPQTTTSSLLPRIDHGSLNAGIAEDEP